MKLDHFDPPAFNDDLDDDSALKTLWSQAMSAKFDISINSVQNHLTQHGDGTCQFYNPVTAGLSGPDLPLAAGEVPWNGFPKRFLRSGPHGTPGFGDAEPVSLPPNSGRAQDEYLEWHLSRNSDGKIVSVEFTCEGYDYYEFLAEQAPGKLVALYQKYINPAVQREDLFSAGSYNRFNHWNMQDGAMHLTNSANNLFAEVFLGASATVRRKNSAGAEITATIPLIKCGEYGDESRNSDPAIGAAVNGLARQGRMITLANPVGLYIASFDGSGFRLPDDSAADGFFQILRGKTGQALRAVYQLPQNLASAGLTVSDVKIGGTPIEFGGQIAQRITMKLTGVASVDQSIQNRPVGCGAVQQSNGLGPEALAEGVMAPAHPPTRATGR
jgi:hypothetical protein